MVTTQQAKEKISRLTSRLRSYRVYHRYLGVGLALFLLISSLTGLLLGWKKDVDLLQPPTQKGVTTDLNQWVPLYQMARIATIALDSAQSINDNPIDRLEARPDKGIVKVLFADGYWEVQLDGSTGKVLSVARRHSDWIEHLHDGSIISDGFKLISMNVLGIGLLVLTLTGLSLWFFPKQIRNLKQ
ncbi:PepSY-associated TM helix domain-containing protein [Pontibacter anaerobius]|uniref:PepSY-associated TM helix domain-containing protein n=1 Tax=Pontibacter anaerobius TaxID=2993940 RepID=A0ABT3RBS5_9BACT|nr:PepSY-associated TM helix domain-containing protein [Pontibacter anaerobius]MCX2738891.1 PepSY-associated TM helix domain-containing protein [Pontibacter anaerobius]